MNKLLLLALLVGYVYGSSSPVQGVVRDQAPDTMSLCGSSGTANNSFGFVGTDFQLPLASITQNEKGIAGVECNKGNSYTNCGKIGADRTPVYAFTGKSSGNSVQSPDSFNTWFHDSAWSYNATSASFYLTNNGTVGFHSNNSFFMFDGQGWNDHCPDEKGVQHNYAWCFEAHFRSGYVGNMTFFINTTLSAFIYMNDYLIVDFGGINTTPQTKNITVDDIPGLVNVTSFRLDFFLCQRHTASGAILGLELYAPPQCVYYDPCGVCEGNGSTCNTLSTSTTTTTAKTTTSSAATSTATKAGFSMLFLGLFMLFIIAAMF